MKKILMSIACVGVLFFATSCDEESTGDVSSITVFPELEIFGDALMLSEVGQPFDDPGADASIAGESVAFETSGDLNTNAPGFYTIKYSVENSDGFAASAQRTVIIYENDGSVAGVYNAIRSSRGFGGPVLLSSRGDGRFNCSDLLGGYYEWGVGYGPAYGFPGVITVDVAGGTVTSAAGGNGGFGPVSLSSGSVAPDGRYMTWFGTLDAYAPFGFTTEYTKTTP